MYIVQPTVSIVWKFLACTKKLLSFRNSPLSFILCVFQAKFEELLKVYPPEAVERKRYQKIAKAMGTRTTQQVASHVQKYFIKLANAGLPVPGRMPNMARYTKTKKVGGA